MSFSKYCVTDDQVRTELKERWLKWRADGYPGGDSNLIPVLEELYCLEGEVIPVFSCASHPGDTTELYISMAVDAKGLERLLIIREMAALYGLSGDVFFHLSFGSLFKMGYLGNSHSKRDEIWRGVCLRVEFHPDSHDQQCIDETILDLAGTIKRHSQASVDY